MSYIEFEPNSGCWLWSGCTSHGYGVFQWDEGRLERAHRVSYQEHSGPIPEGLHVLHRCDVRACCNPAHLYAGTNLQNIADKVARNRQRRGETGANAKLTNLEAQNIRMKHKAGVSQSAIAREYGLHQTTIHHVVTRKTFRHLEDLQ